MTSVLIIPVHVADSRRVWFRHHVRLRHAYPLIPVVSGRRDERFASTLALKLEQGEGVARNVSANGIYFLTDVALEVGEPVRFTLQFENHPGGPIQVNCVARIVRVEERGEKKGVAASIASFEFFRARKPPEKHN